MSKKFFKFGKNFKYKDTLLSYLSSFRVFNLGSKKVFNQIKILQKHSLILFYSSLLLIVPTSVLILFDICRKKDFPYSVKIAKSKLIFRQRMFSFLDDTFFSDDIKKSSKDLVNNIFKDKEVLDALLGTLSRAARSEAFIDQSKIWSKDWIMTILKSDEFKFEVKLNVLRILKSNRTKNEASNYVKDIVLDEEFKQFSATIMKHILLQDHVLGGLSSLFERCVLSALKNSNCKNKCSDLFLIIWRDNNFKNYVYTKSLNFWVNEQEGFSPTIQNTNLDNQDPSYDYFLKNLIKTPKL